MRGETLRRDATAFLKCGIFRIGTYQTSNTISFFDLRKQTNELIALVKSIYDFCNWT